MGVLEPPSADVPKNDAYLQDNLGGTACFRFVLCLSTQEINANSKEPRIAENIILHNIV